MSNTRIKSDIERVQAKIERVRAKHATWHPLAQNTFNAWQSQLIAVRQQAEFASHPMVVKWIKYMDKSITEINDVLLNDLKLPENDRVMLIGKRKMYQETLEMFVPREKVIEAIERDASRELFDGNSHTQHKGLPESW